MPYVFLHTSRTFRHRQLKIDIQSSIQHLKLIPIKSVFVVSDQIMFKPARFKWLVCAWPFTSNIQLFTCAPKNAKPQSKRYCVMFVTTGNLNSAYGFCLYIDSAFMGQSTPTTAFNGAIHHVDALNICIKNFGLKHNLGNDKYNNIFSNMGFAYT